MLLNVGDLLSAKIHLKDMPELKVVIYLLVDKKEPKFLLLNMPYPDKISELLPSVTYSDAFFAGGDQCTDKIFYLHKFKSIRNAQKIAKDLYFLGDFSEIELIDKHGKLNKDNCRFFLGYFTTDIKTIDENRFKKIGVISQEEIFLPFEQIQEYWEKVYVNYLIDTSKVRNADSIENENTNASLDDKSFLKSFLWTKSWLVLSALMNAISLINIGIELKVVTIKWSAFFAFALKFVRDIARMLLYPLSYLLSFANVEIPIIIKDIFLLASILLTSFMRALFEKNRKFKRETEAVTTRRKWGKYFTLFIKLLAQVLIGVLGGLIVAGFTWALTFLIGSHANTVVITIFSIVVIMILIPESNRAKNIEISYLRKITRFYALAVFFFVFLIALINYFYISFNSN